MGGRKATLVEHISTLFSPQNMVILLFLGRCFEPYSYGAHNEEFVSTSFSDLELTN